MLVLTRRVNEVIRIQTASGDVIRVSVAEVQRGGKVRLGIEADASVIIDREEVAVAKRDAAALEGAA
jgi:carbon storage regulator CsrA